MIKRRLGSSPVERGSATGQTCPDILELSNGDFLIIGKTKVPVTLAELERFNVSIAPDEVACILPRRVLLDAKKEIPDE